MSNARMFFISYEALLYQLIDTQIIPFIINTKTQKRQFFMKKKIMPQNYLAASDE